ncbi:MAG: hypothetical protein DRG39_08270 [Deltaproteobacteria bacterium]|nr:MAG: hypothetical protein DRG39_08270 [Deltaproteobacteria bacterium]
MEVYENIKNILNKLGIPFDEMEHPPVKTCDDSAKYRGEHGWKGIGSKNILFHAKAKFYLVVTTAEKEIKARRFKREFGTKNIRFATPDEVKEITGCEIGALPPFGYLNKMLPIYVDEDIFQHEHFMFNPAIHTKSIRIKTEDLKKIYISIDQPVKFFLIREGKTEFMDAKSVS